MDSRSARQQLVTMREAAGGVFPWMVPNTLLKWTRAGIFRPVEYVRGPVGPGKGSKFDFADLVTVGVMSSMFAAGMRYDHLKLDQRTPITAHVSVQRVGVGPDPYFWKKQGLFERIESLHDRPIQRYLERFDSEVVVLVEFKRPDGFMEAVPDIFFGLEQDAGHYWDRSGPGGMEPTERSTFIYCRYWRDFVLRYFWQLT